MEDLLGRIAVITGAGSGIGRASALSLARCGTGVVVTDIDADRCAAVAAEVEKEGSRAIAVPCDVSSLTDLERVRDACLAEFGRVDIVMNNVGVLAMGLPEDIPLAEWQRIVDINLLGTVRSMSLFLPLLLEQGSGYLINTASTAGLFPYSYDRLPYTATKGAIVALTEAVALYLKPKGIGVSCLCPAGVVTNIVEQIRVFGKPPPLRAPDIPVVTAEFVGDLVVDAIRSETFLILTDPEAANLVRRRGDSPDDFLERQLAAFRAQERETQ
jgi:NAD(P)-dependent dehydrogenase (short-subunit alcohol dehydrogenase family)